MKKFLLFLLCPTLLLQAQVNEPEPRDPWHTSPVYPSSTTNGTGRGAARAAKSGNRMGITMAEMGAGLLVGGIVTVIAAIVTNDGSGHSH